MFSKSTAFYDSIFRTLKNYGNEAKNYHKLFSLLGTPPKCILDVACGTGEHAEALSKLHDYQVDGIDLQPEFIDIAQAKCPKGVFTVADMAEFKLPQQYDAILCLFGSIAYVQTPEKLQQTLACMAAHLNLGSWLFIEPWHFLEDWKEDLTDHESTEDKAQDLTINRTRKGRKSGTLSILDITYEIDQPDQATQILAETHTLALFTQSQYESALHSAGFEATYSPNGPSGAPIFMGRKVS